MITDAMHLLEENHVLDRPFTILLAYDTPASCWTAHCLEFDLLEEGRTEREAVVRLLHIMKSNVKDALRRSALRDLFQFAPREYWVQALAARSMPVEKILAREKVRDIPLSFQKLDLKLIPHRA